MSSEIVTSTGAERGTVRTLLIAAGCCLGAAGLVWIPVFVYAAHHNNGRRDMGGAFIAAIALFASGVLLIVCATLAVVTLAVYLFHRNRASALPGE